MSINLYVFSFQKNVNSKNKIYFTPSVHQDGQVEKIYKKELSIEQR